MFCSKQFGFRSKQKTIHILAETTETTRQDTFTCMLFDLRKAIDSIKYEISLVKPEKYGVGRICLKWFESSLKV